MTVRDLVVLILDVVVVPTQDVTDYLILVGSLKYAGKGHPLNFSISLIDKTNIVTNPRQKANSIWGKL